MPQADRRMGDLPFLKPGQILDPFNNEEKTICQIPIPHLQAAESRVRDGRPARRWIRLNGHTWWMIPLHQFITDLHVFDPYFIPCPLSDEVLKLALPTASGYPFQLGDIRLKSSQKRP